MGGIDMKTSQFKIVFSLIVAALLFTNVAFASGWLTDANGCMVWSSSVSLDGESFRWNGKVINGYAEGNSILELYKDGNLIGKYDGTMLKGKRHGKGIFTWINGERYEGDFVDNVRTGKGNMIYANGDRYNGDFFDGARVGTGTFIWTNGDKYIGQWQNGIKHGKGIYIWKSGRKYDGDWLNDKRNGYGTLYNADGSIAEQGQWRDGQIINPVLADTEYVFTKLFENPQEFAKKHLTYAQRDSQFDLWIGRYGNVGEIQLGLSDGKIKYAVIKVNDFDAYNVARPIITKYYGAPNSEGQFGYGGVQAKWTLNTTWINLGASVLPASSYYYGSSERSFMMFEVHPR
jgi:hypothetical protein